jgi:hypothetical protein
MNGILLKDKPAMIYIMNQYSDLRYSIDGTDPDETSPKAGQKFTITGPAQLVLKSFSSSGKFEGVAKGNFELGDMLPSLSKPKKVSAGGLKYSYYEGSWEKLPDFKVLNPVKTGVTDSLFQINKLPSKTNFACLFEGYIEITSDGYYLFGLGSNDGAKLYLSDKLVIDNDGLKKEESTKSFVLPLQKGFYPIRIEYFQKDESCSLNLVYLIPDADNPTNIPAKYQYHK